MDSYHEWVEAWLKENTPTGEWEELQWSGERNIKVHGISVCYIKIRTKNVFGALGVNEYSFERNPGGDWTKLNWPLAFQFSKMPIEDVQRWVAIGNVLSLTTSEAALDRKETIDTQNALRQNNVNFLKALAGE